MKKLNRLTKKRIFITGGAGLIGSNLIGPLIKEKCSVLIYDNLSRGKIEFINMFLNNPNVKFIKGDLLDSYFLKKSIKEIDLVFHLAANSDISYGAKFTDVDLKQGTIATYNVLEAMRENNIREIIFTSTSAIYGDPVNKIPTPEDYGPLFPISLYGASKLACEALISSYCQNFNFKAWIFRLGNVVGPNGTHGVIYDFIKKLKNNPKKLVILGNGEQSKPYLHVKECIDGMIYGYSHSSNTINVFNLACEGGTLVKTIAQTVIAEMNLKDVKLKFTGKKRGWKGDVPYVRLDTSKMRQLGWEPKYSSNEAVKIAVKELLRHV